MVNRIHSLEEVLFLTRIVAAAVVTFASTAGGEAQEPDDAGKAFEQPARVPAGIRLSGRLCWGGRVVNSRAKSIGPVAPNSVPAESSVLRSTAWGQSGPASTFIVGRSLLAH